MNEVKSLGRRIIGVMEEIGYVQKKAKVQGYSAVRHDDVIASVRGAMVKHGLIMTHSVTTSTVTSHKTSKGGDVFKTDVEILSTIFNADDLTDKLEFFCVGSGLDSQDKGIGKAISYAVKYGILKLFCLETGAEEESRIQTKLMASNITLDSFEDLANYKLVKSSDKGKALKDLNISELTAKFIKHKSRYFEKDREAIEKWLLANKEKDASSEDKQEINLEEGNFKI